jgi:copper transporter 1
MNMNMDMGMPAPADNSSSSMAMMGMNQMKMTFFTSASTPLFASSWTPTTTGQYAGTCIFLIVLAIFFRALLAVRLNIIEIMALLDRRHMGDGIYPCIDATKPAVRRRWRANEAALLASTDVVLAGVGYLLSVIDPTSEVSLMIFKHDIGNDHECGLFYVGSCWRFRG